MSEVPLHSSFSIVNNSMICQADLRHGNPPPLLTLSLFPETIRF